MNKLNIIINAFKNKETRNIAIAFGLFDLMAILVLLRAVLTGSPLLFAFTCVIYIIVFVAVRHEMKTNPMRFSGATDEIVDETDEDEMYEEVVEDEDELQ
jgi:uncharacterized integral membrane protein